MPRRLANPRAGRENAMRSPEYDCCVPGFAVLSSHPNGFARTGTKGTQLFYERGPFNSCRLEPFSPRCV